MIEVNELRSAIEKSLGSTTNLRGELRKINAILFPQEDLFEEVTREREEKKERILAKIEQLEKHFTNVLEISCEFDRKFRIEVLYYGEHNMKSKAQEIKINMEMIFEEEREIFEISHRAHNKIVPDVKEILQKDNLEFRRLLKESIKEVENNSFKVRSNLEQMKKKLTGSTKNIEDLEQETFQDIIRERKIYINKIDDTKVSALVSVDARTVNISVEFKNYITFCSLWNKINEVCKEVANEYGVEISTTYGFVETSGK